MKTVIGLAAILLFTFSAQAQREENLDFYTVEYEITGTSPLCPVNAICVLDGTQVQISATLGGCMDKVVHTDYKVIKTKDSVKIQIMGLAKVDPRSASVRCYRAATDVRSIDLVNTFSDNIEIINVSVR